MQMYPYTVCLYDKELLYLCISFVRLLQISFGWSSVKIDMSAPRRVHHPIMPFSISAFAANLFALGLALGTTIAVGMLFFIQVQHVI